MGRLPGVLLRFTVKLKIELDDAGEQSLPFLSFFLSFCSYFSLSAKGNRGDGSIFMLK